MMHSILWENNLPCFKDLYQEENVRLWQKKLDSELTAQFLMAGRENSLKADVDCVFFQEKVLRVYMGKIGFCWRSLDESFTLSSADMIESELCFIKFGTDTGDGIKTVLCAFCIHQICKAFLVKSRPRLIGHG